MIFRGKIQKVLPIQTGTSKNSGNEWRKVEFIVEEIAEYPDILCIAALNDKVDELMTVNVGDIVEVDFRCRCNEYNGRVYNSLSLYRITKEQATAPQYDTAPDVPSPEYNDLPY